MPCEDNNDYLREDLQQAIQLIGADNLNLPGRFNPGMLDGITCSNLLETNIWKKLIKLADFPAHNLPTYCVYGTFLYNFNYTDPKLFQQGFLNLERFPCRKTCGFCGGMFVFSN